MKYYDFKKAKQLIEENRLLISSASLGMHEDWFWTANTVFSDGEYKHLLPDNAEELFDEYCEARKAGISLFDDAIRKYDDCLIGGIYGSQWGTPTLQLEFLDGTDKMIACYCGDGVEMPLADKIENQINWTSGCLSSETQNNITPLEPS